MQAQTWLAELPELNSQCIRLQKIGLVNAAMAEASMVMAIVLPLQRVASMRLPGGDSSPFCSVRREGSGSNARQAGGGYPAGGIGQGN